MTPSTNAITNATAVLIIEVDVPNRILVGSILRAPTDQHTRASRHQRKNARRAPSRRRPGAALLTFRGISTVPIVNP